MCCLVVLTVLTSFQARNTVVWTLSSFNSSNAIEMLLLVASCVGRSHLVDTGRYYTAYSFDSQEFQTRVFTDENINMSFSSDRPFIGQDSYTK